MIDFNGKSDKLSKELLLADFLVTNTMLLLLWGSNVPLGRAELFSKQGYVEHMSDSIFASYAQQNVFTCVVAIFTLLTIVP